MNLNPDEGYVSIKGMTGKSLSVDPAKFTAYFVLPNGEKTSFEF